MITIRNLQVKLGGKSILCGVDLAVKKGEAIALIGLSGSGKTTVLKSLCGLVESNAGSIYFDDLCLSVLNNREIRRRIGYVMQDGGLFPHLSLRDNLVLVGTEAGKESQAIDERIEELANLVRLPLELLSRYPRQVSGGQRQRVGLMRALFLDPPCLLLDEPLGALDPITRRGLQDELKELFFRLKKTVVLVTHDLFEAKRLCERVVLLDEGHVVQVGTMEELIHQPANDFVRQFVQAQDAT